MKFIADLHIHSRFSRATSRDLDFVRLHRSALEKGIRLVGTGDFTHPIWMAEIKEQLEPSSDGLFRLRPELKRNAEEGLPKALFGDVQFTLQVEISNIYKKDGKTRKNHNLIFMPSIDAAERFSQKLAAVGNIASDGRPILGLDARDLLETTLETDPAAFLIPAHVWTPWFSMLGSKSGFDSVAECFGDLSDEIFAVETGLSSDPPMNRRVRDLDRMTLVSNSDAHSAAKLGREANLFDIELAYLPLLESLKTRAGFLGTLEFFPEHGKYHMDGHRKCNLRLSPEETRAYGGRCPICGGLITVGVMSRVADLADPSRPDGYMPQDNVGFESLVPLDEVAAEVMGVGPSSVTVKIVTAQLLEKLGPELVILRDTPLEEIESVAGFPMKEAISRVREKKMAVEAGYDGEFGRIRVFTPKERAELAGQMGFAVSGFSTRSAAGKSQDRMPPRRKRAAATKKESAPPSCAVGAASSRDPLDGLNERQRVAAAAADGPLAVSAGPGTGKTKTLTARIAHHVKQGRWQKDRVLALTFTRQAALEMRERLDTALADLDGDGPFVYTFHAFGKQVLETLRDEEIQIADEETCCALMTSALEASGQSVSRRSVDDAMERISAAKQRPDFLVGNTGDTMNGVFDRYERLLRERKLLDTDDLVLAAYRALQKDAAAETRFQGRFDAVSVDEYQDVNDVQAAMLKMISPTGGNLLVIGDPDQAVYGFRGARPGHFLRFAQDFKGARSVSLDTT